MRFLFALALLTSIFVLNGSSWSNGGNSAKENFVFWSTQTNNLQPVENPQAFFNLALAALEYEKTDVARIALEKCCLRGDSDFESLRIFTLGNVFFVDFVIAEKLTHRVEAGLPAFDRAIDLLQGARLCWIEVVLTTSQSTKAKRNLERLESELEKILERREQFLKNSKKDSQPKDKEEKSKEKETKDQKKQEVEEEVKAQLKELSANQLKRILQLVKKNELEKTNSRRKRRLSQDKLRGAKW